MNRVHFVCQRKIFELCCGNGEIRVKNFREEKGKMPDYMILMKIILMGFYLECAFKYFDKICVSSTKIIVENY